MNHKQGMVNEPIRRNGWHTQTNTNRATRDPHAQDKEQLPQMPPWRPWRLIRFVWRVQIEEQPTHLGTIFLEFRVFAWLFANHWRFVRLGSCRGRSVGWPGYTCIEMIDARSKWYAYSGLLMHNKKANPFVKQPVLSRLQQKFPSSSCMSSINQYFRTLRLWSCGATLLRAIEAPCNLSIDHATTSGTSAVLVPPGHPLYTGSN